VFSAILRFLFFLLVFVYINLNEVIALYKPRDWIDVRERAWY